MKGMSSQQIKRLLEQDGWYEIAVKGSHYQFKHPTKKGRVTLPHPKKDLDIKTVSSIFKQAGL